MHIEVANDSRVQVIFMAYKTLKYDVQFSFLMPYMHLS